jgi:hypothetical protein
VRKAFSPELEALNLGFFQFARNVVPVEETSDADNFHTHPWYSWDLESILPGAFRSGCTRIVRPRV